MARFSHPNTLKLGKSKLDINVRLDGSNEYYPPCHCLSNYSSPLHITFYTHFKHQFLDPSRVSLSSSSNSSAIITEHQEVAGERTICQDGSLFLKSQEKVMSNSMVAAKTALRSVKVKKSRYGRIFREVKAFGRRYNNKNKKVLKGLVVTITIEQSFIGDRDAVHQVMEKSWEESKSQARGDGNILLLNSNFFSHCV